VSEIFRGRMKGGQEWKTDRRHGGGESDEKFIGLACVL